MKHRTLQAARFALTAVAVAATAVTAPAAWALGLGRLNVQSALGENLRAEIDVTSIAPEVASSLQLRVAGPDAYRAAGVDYNAVLPSTQVTLQRRPDGRSVLRLTSDRAVVEPRLVGTPGTIVLPGGAATDDLSDVQDRNVMFVAWGTETNVPDTDSGTPLDLYLTRTINQGASYEKLQVLAGGPNEQSETQLRSPPDGKTVGALWMERDATSGAIDVTSISARRFSPSAD